MKALDNIVETIGNTPLVRLNRIVEGLGAKLYAKLEFLNPGGSVKDRIGIAMIERAEREGRLRPGGTIVEPTSGNTGIGLAIVAALKGYRAVFTMPDKMSEEKRRILRAYGAEVVVTPTDVPPDSPENYYQVAKRLTQEIPNSLMPDQYYNESNPEIHYRTTGPEIWAQSEGEVDAVVIGIGTGGTITGVGRFLKEKKSSVRVVGVDPEGSMYYDAYHGVGGTTHPYKVEGIGEDFMPSTLDFSVIDEVIRVSDGDAFRMARRLAREEGLLVGGSSGAAVFAALRVARGMNEGDVVVVILPDTGRNYLSKLYSDEWMMEHGFLERRVEEMIKVRAILDRKRGIPKLISIGPEEPLSRAIRAMRKYDISQLPVTRKMIQVGSIREKTVLQKLIEKKTSPTDKVGDIMDEPLPSVSLTDDLSKLYSYLGEKNAVVVTDGVRAIGVLTMIDVINVLSGSSAKQGV